MLCVPTPKDVTESVTELLGRGVKTEAAGGDSGLQQSVTKNRPHQPEQHEHREQIGGPFSGFGFAN